MWCNHPFSQRNKATKITVEVKVGAPVGEGGRQNLKNGGGKVANIEEVFTK